MNIGAVIVTYNRLEKLKKTLQCYEYQQYLPCFLLVIDNASTDGTSDYLKSWVRAEGRFPRYLISSETNTGGAGGYYTGMEHALKHACDWVWVSDDDAYPRPEALKQLLDYYLAHLEECSQASALCSAVYYMGEPHLAHRSHLEELSFKIRLYPSAREEFEKEAFTFDILSYVGSCINRKALEQVGLDRKEYFIYHDDQEHSIRLRRFGKMICIPSSIVDHDGPPTDETKVYWGTYYWKRNDILMIKDNYPFRYYALRLVKRYFTDASIFSKKSSLLKKLSHEAYRDAFLSRTGVHELYRPGWMPDISSIK